MVQEAYATRHRLLWPQIVARKPRGMFKMARRKHRIPEAYQLLIRRRNRDGEVPGGMSWGRYRADALNDDV